MPRTGKRDRTEIVAAAAAVTYRQGHHETRLADIAREANLPVGSIYYYFAKKEDVAVEVARHLAERYEANCSDWDARLPPAQRLLAFVDMTLEHAGELGRYGCPLGSLGTELGKAGRSLSSPIGEIFSELEAWATRQFIALGLDPALARSEAEHMLAVLEGATLLAHVKGDSAILFAQGERLKRDVAALAGQRREGETNA